MISLGNPEIMVERARNEMAKIIVTQEMGFASKAANRMGFMDEEQIVEGTRIETFRNAPRSECAQLILSKFLHRV